MSNHSPWLNKEVAIAKMNLNDRIKAFSELGKRLLNFEKHTEILQKAYHQNNWFTEKNVMHAANIWGMTLTEHNIKKWLSNYPNPTSIHSKNVGVINAGNIPFVGLHDFISVLITGDYYIGKNSTGDSILLPYVAGLLCETEPKFKDWITFTEKIKEVDAIIATGSNNTARYFEFYFSKYPHIIRKNRNAIAVLTGKEKSEDLASLGKDIFQYFGLGCRNVSKIYVPKNYDFKLFFESIYLYSEIMQHHKYINNFEYNNAVLLLKRIPFLQNGFLIVMEAESIPSPIAVVHYEYYDNLDILQEKLNEEKVKIQCIVSSIPLNNVTIPVVNFGQAQNPSLWDYADSIDTIQFLTSFE
jgi:hypothetical protein